MDVNFSPAVIHPPPITFFKIIVKNTSLTRSYSISGSNNCTNVFFEIFETFILALIKLFLDLILTKASNFFLEGIFEKKFKSFK